MSRHERRAALRGELACAVRVAVSRRLGAAAVGLLMAAVLLAGAPAPAAEARVKARAAQDQPAYAPEDNFTATWKRADALKVRRDPTNTKPRIPADFPVMTNDVWVWDTWPLVNLDSEPVTYNGWHIIFSLV